MVNRSKREVKEKRQEKVLDMIIRYHTSTAEPVGSNLLSREMGLSSATIRNIMFELEEKGLIKQPYTSAGRVPTDKGYRAYVDSLLRLDEFLKLDKGQREYSISDLKSGSIEHVILKGLHICSRLTTQACIALLPTLKIKKCLMDKLDEERGDILNILYELEDKLYLEGTHYLVEQPEFRDTVRVSTVLKILEDKERLLEILEADMRKEGIKIHIGDENGRLEFEGCTLITARYNFEDDISGALGIIGPMRMEYRRVIPTLSHVAESITELFNEMVQPE